MKKGFLAGCLLSSVLVLSPGPISAGNLPAGYMTTVNFTIKDIECLAKNIYFEARGQPVKGQHAVGFVTLNRVKSQHFHNSVCAVVYAKAKGVCQFSWVCEGKKTIRDKVTYSQIKYRAIKILAGFEEIKDPTRGALFFHAKHVNPKWSRAYMKTATIEDHIFYKPRYNRL